MKRAVIYCRVSSKEQVENCSLKTQEKACREYCSRKGFQVVKLFFEKGESAKTADRPKLQELMAYCAANKGSLHYVLVYNLSRFSRQLTDHVEIQTLLGKLGIKLRSVTEQFDDSPSGKLMEDIKISFAQFENDEKSDRTIKGMKAAFNEGRWVHSPVVGYMRGPYKSPSLIHDPEKAPLVRKAFELYATGAYTGVEITRMLNAKGMRSARNRPLSPQSLENLLRNPLYMGIMREKKWGETKRGDFEPIVSPELFQRVQDMLTGKRPSVNRRHRNHPDFPLRGFVRCPRCGTPLTASNSRSRSGKLYPYYWCREKSCKAVNVRKEVIETRFLDLLSRYRLDPGYEGLMRDILSDVWKGDQSQRVDSRKGIQKRIALLNENLGKLEDTFIFQRHIDEPTYRKHKERLKEELAQAQAELDRLEDETLDVEGLLDFAFEALGEPDALWRRMEPKERLVLQDVYFPAGLTFDGEAFGNVVTSPVFNALAEENAAEYHVGWKMGFEPTASWATTRCSNQLSYFHRGG
jgi:site-specific DNA recombinase